MKYNLIGTAFKSPLSLIDSEANPSSKNTKNPNENEKSKNVTKNVIKESKKSDIVESADNFDAADLAFNNLIAGNGAHHFIMYTTAGYNLYTIQ